MRMTKSKVASFALVLLSIVMGSKSTHFRGGTVSWKHISSSGNIHRMEFDFRFGWRLDYFSVECDKNMIASQSVGYDGGDWRLHSPASSSDLPQSVAIKCTTFEPYENWAYGYNSFEADINSASPFTISFTGGNWISTLYDGADTSWSVALIDVDLGIRSDTNKTNNPPSTLTPPVVRIQNGCPSNITIPILDDDGDRVTCRYGNTQLECDGICNPYPFFTLDEETCTITYDGGGGNYLVGVALMIEDHPSQTITVGGNSKTASDSLSSIPLQFIVDISATAECNIKPSQPNDTIQDNATIPVEEDGSFNDTIDFYPSRPGIAIVLCVVIGPVGMTASDVIHYGGDLYGCIITWEPTDDQTGDFIVCYYAVDADGKQSDQRCFTITVSDTHPCDEDSKGGCSDTCVKSNSSYSCSCDKTCWGLYSDERTCVPNAHLTCDGETIDVEIPTCVTQETVYAEEVSNPNTECGSAISGSSHHLHFDNNQCGVTAVSSAAGIQYKANVYIYHGVYDGPVTRGEWIEVPMTCTLPASSNLTGSFVPEIPINGDFFPNTVYIEGMGTFTFYFDFYKDSGFSSVYGPADYPIQVTVQEYLHFILGAVGSGALEFFTESCVASSERDPDQSALLYPFIQDGCLADPTLESHTPSSPMENRFSIQAFQFSDKLEATPENAEVFIQCSVIICGTDTSTPTRCSQGCLSSSSRRSNNYIYGTIVRFKSDRASKNIALSEEEEEGPPKLDLDESPPQDVLNSFSMLIEDDGGNKGMRASSMVWMTVLTLMTCVVAY